MSTGDSTAVNYRAMGQVAERAQTRIVRLDETVASLKNWVGMLEAAGQGDAAWEPWDGRAHDQFYERLKELVHRLELNAEEMAKFPKELARKATDYAEADGVALVIAKELLEEVQKAQWADVEQ